MDFYSDVTAFSLQRVSQLVSHMETEAAKGHSSKNSAVSCTWFSLTLGITVAKYEIKTHD